MVYFVIDTSETVALMESPPGEPVKVVKEFTKIFAGKMKEEVFRSQVRLTWAVGGMNFSQTQYEFSRVTNQENFVRNVDRVIYSGKGTFTDCAIRAMTEKLMNERLVQSRPGGREPVLFSVFVTDGHVTENHCNGMKFNSDRAQEQGINIFAVAASSKYNKVGMREICNTPSELYQGNYTAIDPRFHPNEDTIEKILSAMVM